MEGRNYSRFELNYCFWLGAFMLYEVMALLLVITTIILNTGFIGTLFGSVHVLIIIIIAVFLDEVLNG